VSRHRYLNASSIRSCAAKALARALFIASTAGHSRGTQVSFPRAKDESHRRASGLARNRQGSKTESWRGLPLRAACGRCRGQGQRGGDARLAPDQ